MYELFIRPYQKNDRQDIIQLWKISHLITPENNPDNEIDEKIGFQPELLIVALLDKKLIGTIMVGYDGHRGWIN